uniref:Uncharacterized protein n=1 Tax=Glossina palpalis gambiensis TaxID=67801 RepID=A0A1B0ANI3_9MUSC
MELICPVNWLENVSLKWHPAVTLRLLLITPLIGGDEEIKDEDEDTPLDEDGDGEGVDGVGEPRVTDVADIFLAVNDKGILPPLPALPNVIKAVGLPIGLIWVVFVGIVMA